MLLLLGSQNLINFENRYVFNFFSNPSKPIIQNMNLDSPKVIVEKSAQHLFDSLSQIKNFEKLMPDSIAKFELISDEEFIFGLKGMPEIKLKIKDRVMPNKIVLTSSSEKLAFILILDIVSLAENKSDVQLRFEGEFNAMMAMMIKGPIGKFIETLAKSMYKL